MNQAQTEIYRFGDFRVDAVKRLLVRGEEDLIPLTPKVFDTLLYLVKNAQRVVEKDEIMGAIWTDTIVEENNLNKNVSILRRILGDKKGEHQFIVTVPGRGYKFVADVVRSDSMPKSNAAFAEGQNDSLGGDNLKFPGENTFQPKDSHESKPHPESPSRYRHPKANRHVLIAVLCVLAFGTAGFYFWTATERVPDTLIKTVAVLPFKPLVSQTRNEALELGMADTLINKLSTSPEIIVRPLGSVRRFDDLEQDVLQAGRELGVDSVLEGTIQTGDDRIRISTRLVRIGDGKQLWTATYNEKFTDIFSVQDSISQKVLAALTLKLSGDQQSRLTKHNTENVEAYQLYMKGRFHSSRLILPEVQKALEYYNEAIRLDPNYALAYVAVAQAYTGFSLSGDVPATEAMPKAKAAAQRAIELDANLPESQVAAGLLAFWYDWNWNEAERKYQRALELDSNNPAAHFFYAHLNSNLGRHSEALTLAARSRELDPLSFIVNSAEGQFLFFAGRQDEAVSRLNKILELNPNFWHAHLVLAAIFIEQKDYSEAVREAEKAAELSGANSQAIALKAYGLAKSGDVSAARIALSQLQEVSRANHVPAYNFALVYNALGETEAALNNLERAFADKNVMTVFLKVDPKWNNLRSEPRFIALIKKMGF